MARALEYAHGLGIVHRDVKPANIIIDSRGTALLMDFGLARIQHAEENLTQDGTVLGTPAYLAPEQADASVGEVGPASDQYSLGVVLYELFAASAFSGPPAVLLYQVRHQEPSAPRSVNPQVPRDLETICLKAMAKSPERRFAGCGELAAELDRWLAGEPIRARLLSAGERMVRWCRRNPGVASLSLTSVLLLLLVATVTSVSAVRMRQTLAVVNEERDRAERERRRAEQNAAGGPERPPAGRILRQEGSAAATARRDGAVRNRKLICEKFNGRRRRRSSSVCGRSAR